MTQGEENRCRDCGAALEPRELVEFGATVADVEVEFYGVRGRACAQPAHPRRPPYADFAADLTSAILYGDAVPCARSRGLVRRRWVCGGCGADLDARSQTRGELRSRIRLPRSAPFTLTLRMPLARCAACRQNQFVPTAEHRQRTLQALESGLEALEGAALAVR